MIELIYNGNQIGVNRTGVTGRRYTVTKGQAVAVDPRDAEAFLKKTIPYTKGQPLWSKPAPVIDATDGAIKLAAENGVDLSEVQGSGSEGRVTQPDVAAFIKARS